MAIVTALADILLESGKMDYGTTQVQTSSTFTYRDNGGLYDIEFTSAGNDLTYFLGLPNGGTITSMILRLVSGPTDVVSVTGLNISAFLFSSSFTGDFAYQTVFGGNDTFDGQTFDVTFYGDKMDLSSGTHTGGNDTMSDGTGAANGLMSGDIHNMSGNSNLVFTGGNDTLTMRSDGSTAYGDGNDINDGILFGGNDSFVGAATVGNATAVGDVRFAANNTRVIGGDDTFNFSAAGVTGQHILIGDAEIVGGGSNLLGGDDTTMGAQIFGLGETHVGDARFNTGSVHGGRDILRGGVNQDILVGDVEFNYAVGIVSGGNDILEGNDGADQLIGDVKTNDAGAAFNGGDDILRGGDGADELYGDYKTNNGVISRGGNDKLYGNAHDDKLFGNEGDDLLDGGTGADILAGGSGDDTLIGGAGGDVLDGGGGTGDVISYMGSGSAVNINLTMSTASGGDATGDTFAQVEGITGSDFNDSLTGDNFNNRLEGSGGSDDLNGLGGADTLIGGDGLDTIYYLSSPSGVTINLTTGLGTGGDAQGDTFDSIEWVHGSAHNDSMTGNNVPVGAFYGHGGDDQLAGFGGNDTYIGGAGNDTFYTHNTGGEDLISDFEGVGAAVGDLINLQNFGFGSFAQVQALMTDAAVDIVKIQLDGDDVLFVRGTGVSIATLTESDFLL